MYEQQLPLFGGQQPAPTLAEALEPFRKHMEHKGFAENTIKSFLGDLRIFAQYAGPKTRVLEISTEDLGRFMNFLLRERGKPCTPKSFARRLTTLKVFFKWMSEAGMIPTDPAANIAHRPVSTPLPTVLSDAEVEQVLAQANAIRWGEKPDARPYLLVRLLLDTGIKKGECMNIRLTDLDASNPSKPVLQIRATDARYARYKERRLALSGETAAALREYSQQYQPGEMLFPCTARNLEYVLTDLGKMVGLDALSFETLRMTAALRDFQFGMDAERLRLKLGLSKMSWEGTLPKLQKLVQPPL
jgi:site-specific recombinase XerD